jgi:hypothetical protein
MVILRDVKVPCSRWRGRICLRARLVPMFKSVKGRRDRNQFQPLSLGKLNAVRLLPAAAAAAAATSVA